LEFGMGIHSGPINKAPDVNERADIDGDRLADPQGVPVMRRRRKEVVGAWVIRNATYVGMEAASGLRMRKIQPSCSAPRIKLGFVMLAIIGAAAVPQAGAQTTQTVTITSVVPQVLSLAIDTNAVAMPFLTSDYNPSTGAATKTVTGANTLSVTSNKSWTVSLKANTAAFAFTPSAGDTDPSKPAGNLSYKLSSAGTFTTITTSNVAVKTGNKGGTATAGNSFPMDYQLTSNLSLDPPGTYTLAIVYTLTAP
jgi:hypothetical protein